MRNQDTISSLGCSTRFYTGRTCNPELYGIRELLYGRIRDLASLSPEGPSQNGDGAEHDTRTSTKLIQLFDNVLQEEYSQDHQSLPLIDQTPHPRTCDYCDGNLFLSAFQCTGRCGIDEAAHSQNIAAMVCPACFVEGRVCICGRMTPARLRSFSTILEQRNIAAAAVHRLGGSGVDTPILEELRER